MTYRNYFVYSLIVFVVAYVIVLNYSNLNSSHKFYIGWQIGCFLSFGLFYYVGRKLSKKSLFICLACYQILFSICLHLYFKSCASTIWGPGAIDAELYFKIAMEITDVSFLNALHIIGSYFDSLSDYGFPLFLRYICKLGGNVDVSAFLLVITNCIFQILSIILISDLSSIITCDKNKTRLIVLLWGLNPASIFLNVAGLKEPIFLLLCIITIWSIYKAKNDGIFKWSIIAFGMIFIIWFFRYYVSLFLIVIYIGYILFPNIWNRFFVKGCVISIVLCLFFSVYLEYFFAEIYYANLATTELYSSSSLFRYSSYLLAFLSPIPKMFDLRTSQSAIMLLYSFIKFFFSIFAIVGSFFLIRKHKEKYYPLIAICLFQILMLIVSAHTIDYRYPYVTMPCFFILMVVGLDYQLKWLTRLYPIFAAMIVVVFNLRVF